MTRPPPVIDRFMRPFWKKKPDDKDNARPAPEPPPADANAPAAPVASVPVEPAQATPESVAAKSRPAAADAEPDAAARPRRWRKRLAGSGFARGLTSVFKRNPV